MNYKTHRLISRHLRVSGSWSVSRSKKNRGLPMRHEGQVKDAQPLEANTRPEKSGGLNWLTGPASPTHRWQPTGTAYSSCRRLRVIRHPQASQSVSRCRLISRVNPNRSLVGQSSIYQYRARLFQHAQVFRTGICPGRYLRERLSLGWRYWVKVHAPMARPAWRPSSLAERK
jgi:hypothetical protein